MQTTQAKKKKKKRNKQEENNGIKTESSFIIWQDHTHGGTTHFGEVTVPCYKVCYLGGTISNRRG